MGYDGKAEPAEITFVYHDEDVPVISAEPATVTVHYVDESGFDIIPPVEVKAAGNAQTVITPDDAPEGFDAFHAEPVTVTVHDGKADIDTITFVYRASIPEVPFGDNDQVGRWGRTNASQVTVRREASRSSRMAGDRIAKDTVLWIVETVMDEDGTDWCHVILKKGTEGYIVREYCDIMTQLESDKYTMESGRVPPGAAEKSEPTAEPKPEGIGYGVTNASGYCLYGVPASAFDILAVLDQGTVVWVERSETLGTDEWYSVKVNGLKGYLPAACVDMISPAEDDATAEETGGALAETVTPVDNDHGDPE